ncbi:hypothetical protein [Marinicella sp. W31]|uniref:hypothetical protein n=1 Tax=Marinicella sp. W31 TaxID=3023713 RepID=UPI0037570D4C
MAIFIEGKSVCNLCGKTIDDTIEFSVPSIEIINELDHLNIFIDSTMHQHCINKDSRKKELLDLISQWIKNSGPGNRKCLVCSNEVTDPDNYFSIGYLTNNKESPLYKYNFLHFHKSHLKDWPEKNNFLSLLTNYRSKGLIKGALLDWLIEDIANQV